MRRVKWLFHAPRGRLGIAFDYAQIVVGSVLVAVGTNMFFVPNRVVSGGVTGISIILHYLAGTPVGAVVFALNLPLLWLGWRYAGGMGFFLRTLVSVVVISAGIDLTAAWVTAPTTDRLLVICYGGLMDGIGMGLVFRGRGTTGGTDVLARLAHRWLGVGIGQAVEDGRTVIGLVDPESPAELAKLREGDVVLKIADRDVTSPDILTAEIRKRKPGQEVTLSIERDGKPMDVKVKLGEYPADEAQREMELRFPQLFRPDTPSPLAAPKPSTPEKAPKEAAPRAVAPRRVPEGFFESRKYIGVYCNALNAELAVHFGVKEGTGLIIAKLTEGGPAEKAKMRVGDIIVRVDGQAVETVDGLIDLIQDKPKGAKIKIEFVRDKKAMTAEVEVAEEESGSVFGSDSLQSFLESWQGYTDAFRNEVREWSSDELPGLRQSLKNVRVKGGLRRI